MNTNKILFLLNIRNKDGYRTTQDRNTTHSRKIRSKKRMNLYQYQARKEDRGFSAAYDSKSMSKLTTTRKGKKCVPGDVSVGIIYSGQLE